MEYANLESQLQIYWHKQAQKEEVSAEEVPTTPPTPSHTKTHTVKNVQVSSKLLKLTHKTKRKGNDASKSTRKKTHNEQKLKAVSSDIKPSISKKRSYQSQFPKKGNPARQKTKIPLDESYQSGSHLDEDQSMTNGYNLDKRFMNYSSNPRETKDKKHVICGHLCTHFLKTTNMGNVNVDMVTFLST